MSLRGRWFGAISIVLLSVNAGWAGHEKMVQKVYPVADLVVEVETADNQSAPQPQACQAKKSPTVAVRVGKRGAKTLEDRLIQIITSTIMPQSWAEQGGPGTIDYHPLTMALVVNQTVAIQDQIADLLAALRRQQDMQVSVEIRFADVCEDTVEHLGLDAKKQIILNTRQMRRLMEEIQSDVHANVMQAPKLTMFNGQTSAINVTDDRTFVTGLEAVYRDDRLECHAKTETVPLGTQLRLHSVISKDRRSVCVHLDARLCNLVSDDVLKIPVSIMAPAKLVGSDGMKTITQLIDRPRFNKVNIERKLTIPAGQTAVLSGGVQEQEARTVTKVPVLGDVPFLGRFFSESKSCTLQHRLLVMVTPRIIVAEEQEQKQSHTRKRVERTNDLRTPIYPPSRNIEGLFREPPDEARILRAMDKPTRVPGIYEESRDNMQIVTEHITEKTDEPRFFPLVGLARLHHSQWKCTVYYTETIKADYPFSMQWSRPCKQVVYIDDNALQQVSADLPGVK